MKRQVRAAQTATTLTVYQAYSPAIGDPAIAAGRFVPPFKRERMTWIKPSFLWMAYRCGWGLKEGQERVLAIEISRTGFEWALAHASLSHFEPGTYADANAWKAAKRDSPVRVQWDPERSVTLAALEHRAIQVGLSGEAVDRYVDEWCVEIRDVTDRMRDVHARVRAGDHAAAQALLPVETPYALTPELAARVGADVPASSRE